MTDGELLKAYIKNQEKTQLKIAEELGIAKQTLVQYYNAKNISPAVKQKLESYFHEDIFTKKKHLYPEVYKQVNEPPRGQNMTTSKLIESLQAQIKTLEEQNKKLEQQNARLEQQSLRFEQRYDSLMETYQALLKEFKSAPEILYELKELVKKASGINYTNLEVADQEENFTP